VPFPIPENRIRKNLNFKKLFRANFAQQNLLAYQLRIDGEDGNKWLRK